MNTATPTEASGAATALPHAPSHVPTIASANPLPHLLQALRVLYPPSAVVHLGVGQGQGELMQWQDWPEVPLAVLIESDANKLHWASQNTPAHWQVLHTTIADSDGSATFYRASNPNEDGLLEPKTLRPWWPKLRSMGKDQRPSQTLDSALVKTPCASGLWLLIDCLPAAQLLAHAPITLMRTQVLCLRSAQTEPDHPLAHASQAALLALLEPLGFIRLAHIDSTHPALGYTLLARNAPLAAASAPGPDTAYTADDSGDVDVDALQYRALVLADKLAKEEAAHQETVVQLHALMARQLRNAQTAAEQKAAQAKAADSQSDSKDSADGEDSQGSDGSNIGNGTDQANAVTATDTDADGHTAPAADQQASAAATAASPFAAVLAATTNTTAQPTGAEAHATTTAATTATADPAPQASNPDIAALQAENAALHHRLALLRDEMIRAEGQINLIKDLMLREQEL